MSTTDDIQLLTQQLEESKRRINLIRSVTFELNQVLTLTDKLNNILETLHKEFGIRYSMILLPNDTKEHLTVKASNGYEDRNLGVTVAFGTDIIGLAAANKKPINITGIRRKKQYISRISSQSIASYNKPGIEDPESQIAIPLLSNDELVAVLMAESQDVSVFSREDESFLITLSQSIAVSIQNSLLFDNMEDLISTRTNELRQINHTKDRLFSIISHDLRGPITSFHNISKLFSHYSKQGDATKIDTLFYRIDQSANQVNNLLDNLLNWALTQTSEIRCEIQKINLAQIINDTVSVYNEQLLAKNLQLELSVADHLHVAGDVHMLSTIFRNVLSNAIKYTPTGGKIKIEATISNDNIVIKIIDSGIGIDPARLPLLFHLDNHISTRGTENEKGTGLGLIVTNEFVQLNKGFIQLTSNPSVGTTVTIQLPAYS